MSKPVLFQLCDDDAAKYPEGDKWFLWDEEVLLDLPSSKLEELERAMAGIPIADLLIGLRMKSTWAMRAAMFLARRMDGVEEKWQHFDPKIYRINSKSPDEEPPPADNDADHEPASESGDDSLAGVPFGQAEASA